jgi:hypothetical protein
MPLVDDDETQVSEQLGRLGTRQQQRQALRRRQQRRWQAPTLPRPGRGRCIAGARFERPRRRQLEEWLAQRSRGVGGERTKWCDPENA